MTTPASRDLCPHCGQPMPTRPRWGDVTRLRELMATVGPRGEPLSVYRLASRTDWAVTYTRGERFDDTTVQALVETGELVPVYPGSGGEKDAYGRASYFGQDSYKRQVADAIARRKRQ